MKAILGVRLIELCTNILSEEGTCHHSDHALTRCFVHAVYADVWDVRCQGWKIPHTDFTTSMSMGVDMCGEQTLKCHRWMPNVSTSDLSPMPYLAGRRRRLEHLDLSENSHSSIYF